MSEVLGSFSADRAALYIANRNCKPNELILVFRKDGFSVCFLFYLVVQIGTTVSSKTITSSVPSYNGISFIQSFFGARYLESAAEN